MKNILIILTFCVSINFYTLSSWANKISLDCDVIAGSTGTNMMEVIISDKKICMGDTSGSPICANVNGKIASWEKSMPHGLVSVTEEKYNFLHYINSDRLLKTVVLDRYTGKATVTYLDKNMNQDYVAIFQCKKINRKKKF
jgi:hypothetical protein